MSARILIVDDLEINVKLMAARLAAEYFDVLTAASGPEALQICLREPLDLVLLDVMMPDMDGYEVCRRLKGDPRTAHLPVVLLTALDGMADRVTGLEAGADDFLTKPVRDLQLFSRVKSLTRLKLLTDELRVRAETSASLVTRNELLMELAGKGTGGRVCLVEDDARAAERLARLLGEEHKVHVEPDPAVLTQTAIGRTFDLFVIGAGQGFDPLRLCSRIRSSETTRGTPILLAVAPDDDARTARALEIGANDYIVRPIDRNELLARVRTQIKRKRYDDGLRETLQRTLELAITDSLTRLHNRRFFDAHLLRAVERSRREGKPLALLIADIDHFKRINDEWGHDAGDMVLRQFAARLAESVRGSDLACRFGGEEFVVLMPEADHRAAEITAERLRQCVADTPFETGRGSIPVTVSSGYAVLSGEPDDADTLLKRADAGLYAAKRAGRNRVMALAA
ncbi:PleD family two-component system response regulator [Mangrovibrevibacter kandeliae]|uniref:PleD family two-component system response regulator n=1 Tax=Mangrovibrevibacter kandeliae TaxID=2968473 RepID=UPI002117858E|nr:PleD family two-component system response regulator [Aurantimonas sp. CSK15Z-1]MCQ8782501.1 PleD family two-component system response regulator [Aurantimonas sp. CSK15Z-1]